MRRFLSALLFLTTVSTAWPQSPDAPASIILPATESVSPTEPEPGTSNPGFVKRIIRAFNTVDTAYITPQKYIWSFMLQNTNSFEGYSLSLREQEQKLAFSPKPGNKFGPYIRWQCLFLGYTFDLTSFDNGAKSKRTEFEMCLYNSMLGCDLIYRRTGEDYRLRKVKGLGEEAKAAEGSNCSGINVKVTGVNAYYIFNHKRCSYPAAFAKSTIQRRSCGTWKVGLSFTRHALDFDYETLPPEVTDRPDVELSPEFNISQIKYDDYSLSVGYAYNWVFKRNWLFCISISPAIGYKKARNDMQEIAKPETDFILPAILKDLNFDCTGRVGLVWNTMKYFGGLSLIVHNYSYRHNRLSISNTFGTLKCYWGLNFHKRKAYR